jgi:hypothetical protein
MSRRLLGEGTPSPKECDTITLGEWRAAQGLPPVSQTRGVRPRLGILGPRPAKARSPIEALEAVPARTDRTEDVE